MDAPEIFRRRGGDFQFAAAFLPVVKRDAAAALFAFCDLLSDAIKSDSIDERLALVHSMIDAIYLGEIELPKPQFRDQSQHVLAAFSSAVKKFQIPKQPILDFVEGRRMDQTITRYATWASLRRYCERSAGSVAIATSCIVGLTSVDARAHLIDAAVGVRLTQILRNLKSDLSAERILLPLEDLARFRVSQRQLVAGNVDEKCRRLMAQQVGRARELLDKGLAALPFLGSDRARMSIATIVTLHRAILDSIERRGYDLGRRPISLTMPQKLRALPEAWRIARNA